MVTLAKLHTFVEKGYRVTVVGPSAYHYYSGMGPGMLGKTYTPEEIRFATQHVVEKQGGRLFLEKPSASILLPKPLSLESGDQIAYDVISFNAGSYVPLLNLNEMTGDIFSAKPIERLLEAQTRILECAPGKKSPSVSSAAAHPLPKSRAMSGN